MNKVLIIAEAGVNHNGSLEKAFALVDVAVEAGVDMVKFQTFKAEALVVQSAPTAEYQQINTKNTEQSQLEMLRQLELSDADHQALLAYCKTKGITFFSTAFDIDSLQYLKDLGFTLVKIPSGEITNLPYLRKAASLFSEVILSTGMCTLDEVEAAVKVFEHSGICPEKITILHCNTEYPTPMEDVNLRAMLQLKDKFGTAIGYSDHTLGIEVPIAAVAMGATVIEKHFTLDTTLPGPDHAASLNPDALKAMVTAVRNIEKAISGSGMKTPSPSELKNISIARKSIVAKVDIPKGTLFNTQNLDVKRPGNGISPMLWDAVLGKSATQDFKKDDLIVL